MNSRSTIKRLMGLSANDTAHPEHFGGEYSEGYAPQRLGDPLFAREIAFDVYGWSRTEYHIIGWTVNP